jgi:hypothetical protein
LGCLQVLCNKILKGVVFNIYIAEIWKAVVCGYQSAVWRC